VSPAAHEDYLIADEEYFKDFFNIILEILRQYKEIIIDSAVDKLYCYQIGA
jgi:hypothetical protein